METSAFADGLGRRLPLKGEAGERLESLRLCAEVGDTPTTQAALVERASRLSTFDHPAFARVRRVERLEGVIGGLAVVSVAADGIRLSDLLRQAERRNVPPDLNGALHLLQQVVSAIAALHAHSRDAAHGAIGPERVVVQPDGSAVVVEYVLASALEQLQLSRSQLWALFRVPAPSVAGAVRFDQQTDVLQLGVLALALILGRVLLREEFPQRISGLMEEAATLDACHGGRGGLSRPLRTWVARALQLDSRSAFRNAVEAESALAAAIAEDRVSRPSVAPVRLLLSQCSPEQAPGSGPQPRATPSGAVVSIPHRGDTTTRVGPRTGGFPDRGSGAHRVSRPGTEHEPTSVQVLADLSLVPREPGAPAPVPAARSSSSSVAAAVRSPHHGERWAALRRLLRVGAVVLGLVMLFGVTYLGARAYFGLPTPLTAKGTLVVESRPAGLELLVDGVSSGRTPATLELTAGSHTVSVKTMHGARQMPVTVVAGTRKVERIEVPPAPRSRRRR